MKIPRALFLLVCAVLTTPAAADDPSKSTVVLPPYHIYLEGGGRLGTDDSFGQATLFSPLVITPNSLIFSDFRLLRSVEDQAILGLGLGYRYKFERLIFGAYAYVDDHRQKSLIYDRQGTFGMELMTVDWDLRLNGYLPNDEVSYLQSRASLLNGNLVVSTISEAAYPGADFLAGCLLDDWKDGQIEWRAYAGGYLFSRNDGFESRMGPRLRTELRLYDLPWLGNGSRLVAAGQFDWDQMQGSRGLASLILRIPLRLKKQKALGRLERRMLEPVLRQPGVMVGRKRSTEAAAFPDGRPVTAAAVFDATTLTPAALSALGKDSVAVIDGRGGTIHIDKTLVLNEGQSVIGGTTQMTVIGRDSRIAAYFAPSGQRPLIVQSNQRQDIIELPRQGGTVAGLDLIGGQNGISGNYVSNAKIIGNRVGRTNYRGGIGGNGITVVHPGENISIQWNRLEENRTGIHVGDDLDGDLVSNTLVNNSGTGVKIVGDVYGDVIDNTAESNGGYGIRILGSINGELSNNSAMNHRSDGISIRDGVTGDVAENVANNNIGNGIEIGGTIQGSVSGNTANDNYFDGLSLDADVNQEIADNVASRNGENGLSVGDVLGPISGNSFNENGKHDVADQNFGLRIDGSLQGEVFSNTFRDNSGEGAALFLRRGDNVLFRNNELSGNNDGFSEFAARLSVGELPSGRVRLQDNSSHNFVPNWYGSNFRHTDGIDFLDLGGNVGTIDH